ncbi:cobalt-zinc-cadmium efflux system outer membrane protein [Roseateles toxinivorans]|uniref:Cobalt-zinc-cadmium efflux system outer membrane protein n=2 Tax=Roseateles toxinivorans TaxID=270368 RepID=A0A4R6QEL3_9BURK|nr:cobalt-zinc-cadmium efflux system outer membrane protein [Roseateles toxinivorans]
MGALLACSAALWLGAGQARANEAIPATLAQAFKQAWSQQAEGAAAPARRDAAQGRKNAAGAWTAAPPVLELSGRSDRLNRNQGSREIELGVSAALWLPGERQLTLALADAELGALDSRQLAARWRLAGAVREAWWALQLAALDQQSAQTRITAAAQLARDVTRRVAAGDLSRADQHQADAAVATAEAEAAQAQAALAQAAQTLRSWGLAPDLARQDMALPEPNPEARELEAAHPALRELSDRARLAERSLALASRQRRGNPELLLSTTRQRASHGESSAQTVMLGLRIPFGSAGAHQARQAGASADQIEAQTLLALEQRRLRAEVESAQARLTAARAGAEAAARRAILARETRGFIEKAFRLGEADLPSRLRVEQEAFEAERQQARAGIGVSQAISALRQALGLLPL